MPNLLIISVLCGVLITDALRCSVYDTDSLGFPVRQIRTLWVGRVGPAAVQKEGKGLADGGNTQVLQTCSSGQYLIKCTIDSVSALGLNCAFALLYGNRC